jgi:hypothetical protein
MMPWRQDMLRNSSPYKIKNQTIGYIGNTGKLEGQGKMVRVHAEVIFVRRRTVEMKIFSKTFFLNIYFYFIFQRNIGSKRASLVSLVTPGSPTKKPYSPVASTHSNAFKGAAFAGRKSTSARNIALEKEGKLFVQVLYPENVFTAGFHLQPFTSRLCSTRVEMLFLCGIATPIFARLHSKKF